MGQAFHMPEIKRNRLPMDQRTLAGRITVEKTFIRADCLLPACAYHCSYVGESVKASVKKVREKMQAHLGRDHKLHVSDYYLALVVNG